MKTEITIYNDAYQEIKNKADEEEYETLVLNNTNYYLLNTSRYHIDKLKVMQGKNTPPEQLISTLYLLVEHIALLPFRSVLLELNPKEIKKIKNCKKIWQILDWNDISLNNLEDKLPLLISIALKVEDTIDKLWYNLKNKHIEENIKNKSFSRSEIIEIIESLRLYDVEIFFEKYKINLTITLLEENFNMIDYIKINVLDNLSPNEDTTLEIEKTISFILDKNKLIKAFFPNCEIKSDLLQKIIFSLINAINEKAIKYRTLEQSYHFINKTFFFKRNTHNSDALKYKLEEFEKLFNHQKNIHFESKLKSYMNFMKDLNQDSCVSETKIEILLSIYNKVSELLLTKTLKVSLDGETNNIFSFGEARGIRNIIVHSLDQPNDYKKLLEFFIINDNFNQFNTLSISLIKSILDDIHGTNIFSSTKLEKLNNKFKNFKEKLQSNIHTYAKDENNLPNLLTFFIKRLLKLMAMLDYNEENNENSIPCDNIGYSAHLDFNLEAVGEIAGIIIGKNGSEGALTKYSNSIPYFEDTLYYDNRIKEVLIPFLDKIIDFRNQLTHSMTNVGYEEHVKEIRYSKDLIIKIIKQLFDEIELTHKVSETLKP